MLRLIQLVAACSLCNACAAEVIYKCTVDGKVAYGQARCEHGRTTELRVPAAPAPDPQLPQTLLRERATLAALERQRHLRELRDAREAKLDRRAGNAARQRCERLRLQKKWADEDLARASGPAVETQRRKARRQAEAMAIACPP